MRWSEVSYLHDGMRARVRFDTPADPGVVNVIEGVVLCSGPGCVPCLHSRVQHATDEVMLPPAYEVMLPPAYADVQFKWEP